MTGYEVARLLIYAGFFVLALIRALRWVRR